MEPHSVVMMLAYCDRPYLLKLMNSENSPCIFTMRTSLLAIARAKPSISYFSLERQNSKRHKDLLDGEIVV
jgi:hypothetical protein